jgi:hypothetical protein
LGSKSIGHFEQLSKRVLWDQSDKKQFNSKTSTFYNEILGRVNKAMDIHGTVILISKPLTTQSLIAYYQGFEWDVRDVHKLRDFVEGMEPQDDDQAEHGNFEILKQSPVLGDNKFKLEIGQFA